MLDVTFALPEFTHFLLVYIKTYNAKVDITQVVNQRQANIAKANDPRYGGAVAYLFLELIFLR